MPRKLKVSPSTYESDGDAMSVIYHLQAKGEDVPIPLLGTSGTDLYAYVNHGRWIVDCDQDANAQCVDPEDPRFFCIKCENDVSAGGQWREVIFPAEIDEIESALIVRPIENRNWKPGETVEQLEAENIARELPANDEA